MLAQPGLGEGERELELADALRALEQQGMRALARERALDDRCQPWQRQATVGAYHPRARKAASICCQTVSRLPAASMRA